MASVYAVTDPATGEQIATYPRCTDEEVTAAIDAADRAHDQWSTTPLEERVAVLARVAELHSERREELAGLIVKEMGKPLAQALGEVDFSAMIYGYYAENAAQFLADEPITLPSWSTGTALVRQSSLGPLLGIMPWNFPYYQVARFAGPNVVAGNTVLLKHASQCPTSAAAIEQIFLDAGAPAGVYRNLYASTDQVAQIIADPRVQGVSLTGSEGAGRTVGALAGQHLKKVVLELGGSDPFVVLSTDDLDATVAAAASARLSNSGQACNAAKRFIVADEYYEDFLTKMSEIFAVTKPMPPADPDAGLGPLSSARAASDLYEQVEGAVADGARLVVGGAPDGAFFSPTVLTDVTPANRAHHEEFFGPVALVYRAGSEDEAVELANDTPFGLGAYVFSTDREQALRVADRLDAGMVFVNGVHLESPELPFGGVKASGFGRELGRYGMTEFLNRKLIRVKE
ncbi:NAD-dependent succinate-semialdehyde dehydrogenase [Blastococcus sp. SYSU D00695]